MEAMAGMSEGDILLAVMGGVALLLGVQWGMIRFGDRLWKSPASAASAPGGKQGMSDEIEMLRTVAEKVTDCHGCGTQRDATVAHLGEKVDSGFKAIAAEHAEQKVNRQKFYEKIEGMNEKVNRIDGRLIRVETKVLNGD